jgi:hypothetical protein
MAYYNIAGSSSSGGYGSGGSSRSKHVIRRKDFGTKAYFNILWEQVYAKLEQSLKTPQPVEQVLDDEVLEMTRMIFEDRSSETQVRYIQLFPSDADPTSVMRGPGNHSQVDSMASLVRYRFQSFPDGYVFLYCRPPHPKKKFNMCVKEKKEKEKEGEERLVSKRETFVYTPKNIENPGCGTRSIELFSGIDVNIPIYPAEDHPAIPIDPVQTSDYYFNLKLAGSVPYNRKQKNTTGIIYVTSIEMIKT